MAEHQSDKTTRKFADRVNDYLFADVKLKLLAALVVAVIWFSVGGQTRPAAPIKIHGVDVSLDRVPPQFSVTSTEPTDVAITVEGPEDLLRELRIAVATRSTDLVAQADLATLQQGVQMAHLSVTGLPEGIRLVSVDPDAVRVFLDPITRKDVKVQPRYAGSPPNGYKFTGATTVPEYVTLSVPSSLLDKINEVPTTTISLNRTSSFEEPVDLDITGNDILVTERPVLRVSIAEDVGSRSISVPVSVMGAIEAQTDPPTVLVKLHGPMPALNALKPEDITARITVVAGKQSFVPEIVVGGPNAPRIQVESVTPAAVRWRK
ncbi:MAG TPA: CdaR family protein [Blastocatellia bacterium]|nr:CdaR family protein [Blastocatellia bacterium]